MGRPRTNELDSVRSPGLGLVESLFQKRVRLRRVVGQRGSVVSLTLPLVLGCRCRCHGRSCRWPEALLLLLLPLPLLLLLMWRRSLLSWARSGTGHRCTQSDRETARRGNSGLCTGAVLDPGRVVGSCAKRLSFQRFPSMIQCLSRACLGKTIVFMHSKTAPKRRVYSISHLGSTAQGSAGRRALRKRNNSFLTFPYVCPEPVLVQ
jgi:hypothetical protein